MMITRLISITTVKVYNMFYSTGLTGKVLPPLCVQLRHNNDTATLLFHPLFLLKNMLIFINTFKILNYIIDFPKNKFTPKTSGIKHMVLKNIQFTQLFKTGDHAGLRHRPLTVTHLPPTAGHTRTHHHLAWGVPFVFLTGLQGFDSFGSKVFLSLVVLILLIGLEKRFSLLRLTYILWEHVRDFFLYHAPGRWLFVFLGRAGWVKKPGRFLSVKFSLVRVRFSLRRLSWFFYFWAARVDLFFRWVFSWIPNSVLFFLGLISLFTACYVLSDFFYYYFSFAFYCFIFVGVLVVFLLFRLVRWLCLRPLDFAIWLSARLVNRPAHWFVAQIFRYQPAHFLRTKFLDFCLDLRFYFYPRKEDGKLHPLPDHREYHLFDNQTLVQQKTRLVNSFILDLQRGLISDRLLQKSMPLLSSFDLTPAQSRRLRLALSNGLQCRASSSFLQRRRLAALPLRFAYLQKRSLMMEFLYSNWWAHFPLPRFSVTGNIKTYFPPLPRGWLEVSFFSFFLLFIQLQFFSLLRFLSFLLFTVLPLPWFWSVFFFFERRYFFYLEKNKKCYSSAFPGLAGVRKTSEDSLAALVQSVTQPVRRWVEWHFFFSSAEPETELDSWSVEACVDFEPAKTRTDLENEADEDFISLSDDNARIDDWSEIDSEEEEDEQNESDLEKDPEDSDTSSDDNDEEKEEKAARVLRPKAEREDNWRLWADWVTYGKGYPEDDFISALVWLMLILLGGIMLVTDTRDLFQEFSDFLVVCRNFVANDTKIWFLSGNFEWNWPDNWDFHGTRARWGGLDQLGWQTWSLNMDSELRLYDIQQLRELLVYKRRSYSWYPYFEDGLINFRYAETSYPENLSFRYLDNLSLLNYMYDSPFFSSYLADQMQSLILHFMDMQQNGEFISFHDPRLWWNCRDPELYFYERVRTCWHHQNNVCPNPERYIMHKLFFPDPKRPRLKPCYVPGANQPWSPYWDMLGYGPWEPRLPRYRRSNGTWRIARLDLWFKQNELPLSYLEKNRYLHRWPEGKFLAEPLSVMWDPPHKYLYDWPWVHKFPTVFKVADQSLIDASNSCPQPYESYTFMAGYPQGARWRRPLRWILQLNELNPRPETIWSVLTGSSSFKEDYSSVAPVMEHPLFLDPSAGRKPLNEKELAGLGRTYKRAMTKLPQLHVRQTPVDWINHELSRDAGERPSPIFIHWLPMDAKPPVKPKWPPVTATFFLNLPPAPPVPDDNSTERFLLRIRNAWPLIGYEPLNLKGFPADFSAWHPSGPRSRFLRIMLKFPDKPPVPSKSFTELWQSFSDAYWRGWRRGLDNWSKVPVCCGYIEPRPSWPAKSHYIFEKLTTEKPIPLWWYNKELHAFEKHDISFDWKAYEAGKRRAEAKVLPQVGWYMEWPIRRTGFMTLCFPDYPRSSSIPIFKRMPPLVWNGPSDTPWGPSGGDKTDYTIFKKPSSSSGPTRPFTPVATASGRFVPVLSGNYNVFPNSYLAYHSSTRGLSIVSYYWQLQQSADSYEYYLTERTRSEKNPALSLVTELDVYPGTGDDPASRIQQKRLWWMQPEAYTLSDWWWPFSTSVFRDWLPISDREINEWESWSPARKKFLTQRQTHKTFWSTVACSEPYLVQNFSWKMPESDEFLNKGMTWREYETIYLREWSQENQFWNYDPLWENQALSTLSQNRYPVRSDYYFSEMPNLIEFRREQEGNRRLWDPAAALEQGAPEFSTLADGLPSYWLKGLKLWARTSPDRSEYNFYSKHNYFFTHQQPPSPLPVRYSPYTHFFAPLNPFSSTAVKGVRPESIFLWQSFRTIPPALRFDSYDFDVLWPWLVPAHKNQGWRLEDVWNRRWDVNLHWYWGGAPYEQPLGQHSAVKKYYGAEYFEISLPTWFKNFDAEGESLVDFPDELISMRKRDYAVQWENWDMIQKPIMEKTFATDFVKDGLDGYFEYMRTMLCAEVGGPKMAKAMRDPEDSSLHLLELDYFETEGWGCPWWVPTSFLGIWALDQLINSAFWDFNMVTWDEDQSENWPDKVLRWEGFEDSVEYQQLLGEDWNMRDNVSFLHEREDGMIDYGIAWSYWRDFFIMDLVTPYEFLPATPNWSLDTESDTVWNVAFSDPVVYPVEESFSRWSDFCADYLWGAYLRDSSDYEEEEDCEDETLGVFEDAVTAEDYEEEEEGEDLDWFSEPNNELVLDDLDWDKDEKMPSTPEGLENFKALMKKRDLRLAKLPAGHKPLELAFINESTPFIPMHTVKKYQMNGGGTVHNPVRRFSSLLRRHPTIVPSDRLIFSKLEAHHYPGYDFLPRDNDRLGRGYLRENPSMWELDFMDIQSSQVQVFVDDLSYRSGVIEMMGQVAASVQEPDTNGFDAFKNNKAKKKNNEIEDDEENDFDNSDLDDDDDYINFGDTTVQDSLPYNQLWWGLSTAARQNFQHFFGPRYWADLSVLASWNEHDFVDQSSSAFNYVRPQFELLPSFNGWSFEVQAIDLDAMWLNTNCASDAPARRVLHWDEDLFLDFWHEAPPAGYSSPYAYPKLARSVRPALEFDTVHHGLRGGLRYRYPRLKDQVQQYNLWNYLPYYGIWWWEPMKFMVHEAYLAHGRSSTMWFYRREQSVLMDHPIPARSFFRIIGPHPTVRPLELGQADLMVSVLDRHLRDKLDSPYDLLPLGREMAPANRYGEREYKRLAHLWYSEQLWSWNPWNKNSLSQVQFLEPYNRRRSFTEHNRTSWPYYEETLQWKYRWDRWVREHYRLGKKTPTPPKYWMPFNWPPKIALIQEPYNSEEFKNGNLDKYFTKKK